MRHFHEQLQELLQKIVMMGSLAETMIDLCTKALVERDESLIAVVKAKEEEVNTLHLEIDDQAIKLTALQQPVASDVRFIFVASRIATDVERIGDQTINICENSKHVLKYPPLKPLVDIPVMAEICKRMLHESLTAMIQRDVNLAQHVLEEEKKVDAYRDQIFRVLLTYMMSDPGTIQRALSLLLISRNMEKIGDHATSIAEEVIYLVQGRDIRHSMDKSRQALPKV